MSLGHLMEMPSVQVSSSSFTARETISDSTNWFFASMNVGNIAMLNMRFLPFSDSHELPRCPFPAVWKSATTVVKSLVSAGRSLQYCVR